MTRLAGLATLCLAVLACQHDEQPAPAARPVAPAVAPAPPVIAQSPTSSACASAVGRLAATVQQAASYLRQPEIQPQMKLWFDRAMVVFRESCEQDQWPTTMIDCMSGARDLTAMADHCGGKAPPALVAKLQARMTRALHDLTPQLTQPVQ